MTIEDGDIVEFLLAMVRAEFPQCTDAQAIALDERARAVWGGERVRVRKTTGRAAGRRPLTDEQRQQVITDGMSSAPTEDVLRKHGISRASLYRMLKPR